MSKETAQKFTLYTFIAYDKEDIEYLERIERSLMVLEKNNEIRIWNDKRVIPGSEYKKEVISELRSAELILLLLSDNFLANDFCYEFIMPKAFELNKSNSAIVIPIIIKPCSWKYVDYLNGLKVIPRKFDALSLVGDIDYAVHITATEIKEIINRIEFKRRKQINQFTEKIIELESVIVNLDSNLNSKNILLKQKEDEILNIVREIHKYKEEFSQYDDTQKFINYLHERLNNSKATIEDKNRHISNLERDISSLAENIVALKGNLKVIPYKKFVIGILIFVINILVFMKFGYWAILTLVYFGFYLKKNKDDLMLIGTKLYKQSIQQLIESKVYIKYKSKHYLNFFQERAEKLHNEVKKRIEKK